MAIIRTVATFALGYAAARAVDHFRAQSANSDAKPGESWASRAAAEADKAQTWMKDRADKFRDQYTTPRDDSAPGPDAG